MNPEPTNTAWRSFRFRKQIGSGGFGEVYQAEMSTAGGFAKIVAVKLLRPDFQDDPDVVARLRDEARLLGQLRHPAIVQADDLVYLAGRLAVIMEYVPGANLITLIDPRHNPDPVPPPVVLGIIRRVAEALDAAWSRPSTISDQPLRVMHRDIKPSNIRVTPDGEVKVLDFGVARADSMDRDTTTQDQLIGSLPYMPPEAFLHQPTGHLSDVYALGVVLYEALARARFGRCGLWPEKHLELVTERLLRLDLDSWGDSADDLIALLTRMLLFESAGRPTAREVSDRCRELEGTFSGPSLDLWARAVVARLAAQPSLVEDGTLAGQTLAEDTASRLTPATALAGVDERPTDPGLAAPLPTSQDGPTGSPAVKTAAAPASLPWLAIGGTVVLLVLVVLLLVWAAWPRPEPAPPPPVTMTVSAPDVGSPGAAPATGAPDAANTPAPPQPPKAQPTTSTAARPATPRPATSRPATPETVAPSAVAAEPTAEPTTIATPPTLAQPPPDAPPQQARFSSRPLGVAVTVDGVYRGSTPIALTLSSGNHRVVFESGGQTRSADIQVGPEQKNLWTFNVAEGAIR